MFQDLTNLSRLRSLRTLGVKSSIYPASPVGLLCNYAIHVIYHLPQLTHLDDSDIDGKAIRDLMEVRLRFISLFFFFELSANGQVQTSSGATPLRAGLSPSVCGTLPTTIYHPVRQLPSGSSAHFLSLYSRVMSGVMVGG